MSVKVNVHVEESAAADVVVNVSLTVFVSPSHVFATLPAAASGTVSLPAWSSAEPVEKNSFISLLYVECTYLAYVRT